LIEGFGSIISFSGPFTAAHMTYLLRQKTEDVRFPKDKEKIFTKSLSPIRSQNTHTHTPNDWWCTGHIVSSVNVWSLFS